MPPTPDIPFDVSYVMPDGLRAQPVEPPAMAAAVDWLESAATQAVGRERARLLGLAGAYAGMLRQLERAHALLTAALDTAAEADDGRLATVNRIRLADVVALTGDPEGAVTSLRAVLATGVHDDLTDFVHQHLGKALLEAGDVRGAVHHLELALAVRRAKGDESLVASTEAALTVARDRAGS